MQQQSKLLLSELQHPRTCRVLGVQSGNLFLQIGYDFGRFGPRRLRSYHFPDRLTLLLMSIPFSILLSSSCFFSNAMSVCACTICRFISSLNSSKLCFSLRFASTTALLLRSGNSKVLSSWRKALACLSQSP
ncbi:hypothetical protein GBA52_026502 [Prunus armeniaca]|nr:hypothetical protein GBA52_026502 [Prunus armeniaca]